MKEVLATLHEVETYLAEREDVVDGDYGQPAPNKEMTLLVEVRTAIRALSADRGEAVAWQWRYLTDEGPAGWTNCTRPHFDMLNDAFYAGKIETRELYAATPPSPAESAEGDGECAKCGAPTDPDYGHVGDCNPSAPSQVSDAAVKRAVHVFANQPSGSYDDGAEERLMRAVLEDFAAQPQPGRVEGMVRVPVEPTPEMVRAGSIAADGLGTPLTRTANAYRAMIASAPTAGGDA